MNLSWYPCGRKHKAAQAVALLALLAAGTAQAQSPAPPTSDYWVYVGAESADLIHRVRFGPAGATVEKTIRVGESPTEMEGPHGLQISRDGRFLHLTTGHGSPDGKYWRYVTGADTLAGPGVLLGFFPASLDVTPDGLYAFVVNFNLHGSMEPSSVSVVYTPGHTEVARTETCTMPHGSRISPDGGFQYSTCMMDDQLVELDTRTFAVSRRLDVGGQAGGRAGGPTGGRAGGQAGTTDHSGHAGPPARHNPTCSPTWAQPSVDGRRLYVACNRGDEILDIDAGQWTITRRLRTGRGPYNLAVTPDGRRLLVSLKQGSAFQVFDLGSGTSVFQAPSSTTLTHGVAVSPDSRYAFVSSEGVGAAPGKVDVYDLTALARVASVDVGQQAGGITFWKMEPAR